jgi:hypothetical protein
MKKQVAQIRKYPKGECIAFRKTKEKFGGLSNMASGYPLLINNVKIRSSEALYQACRYPLFPEIQKEIIEQKSPMTAKMKSKKYLNQTRQDWESVRFKIMRWCLEVKLLQNWEKFSLILKSTGDKPIVEATPKDKVWGAVLINDSYEGVNALGRLLMELRERYIFEKQFRPEIISPPEVNGLILFNEFIGPIPVTVFP